jgi:hypothetical protein
MITTRTGTIGPFSNEVRMLITNMLVTGCCVCFVCYFKYKLYVAS